MRLEDTLVSRFFEDTKGVVVDSFALYLVTELTKRHELHGVWYSFYFNKVFKDYLYKIFGDNERDYNPVIIERLLSLDDEQAASYLTDRWLAQFERVQLKLTQAGTKSYHALATLKGHSNLNQCRYSGSHSTALEAALLALSGLSYKVSTTVLTEKLRMAKSRD